MGIDLTGKQIKLTYDGLLKSTDNLSITSEKQITDGLGNDLPLKLSPTTIKFPGIMNFSETTSYVSAPWAGFQTDIDALSGDVITNTTNISNNSTAISNLEAGSGNVIDVNGETGSLIFAAGDHLDIGINSVTNTFTYSLEPALYNVITGNTDTADSALTLGLSNLSLINTNANNIQTNTTNINALVNGINNVISFGISGGTELVGDVTISEGNNVTFTQNGNNIEINASGTGGGAVDDINGLTGSVDLVSTDLDFLTITTNGQDIEFDVLPQRTILEDVKNTTASTIFKGTPLHITGSTGNEAEVIPASHSGFLSAHLVANENITAGSSGKAVAIGFINNVTVGNLALFQPGTEVYLGNGTFLSNKPTGNVLVQYLGVVVKASGVSGPGTISGIIQNLGVGNQLPNLEENYIWLGDSNDVPQAVDFTQFTGGTSVVQTYTNGVDNRVITSTGVDGINGEANLLFDGSNLDIKGQGTTNGVRINGGNIGGATPSISTIDGTGQISITNDIVLGNQVKIAFDGDPTNTYIAADSVNPENLVFHADADLQFFPDTEFEVYTTSIGAQKVFNIQSGSSNARVGIGYPAEFGSRELYVKGGIQISENFFDYEGTQSGLTWHGETINLGTAVSTTAGNLYYFNGTTWIAADADVLSSASSLLGLAIGSSSNKGMLINGWYKSQTTYSSGQIYMSPTAGGITSTQPSTSGQYVRVIGHGTNTNLFRFNPSNDFYEVE